MMYNKSDPKTIQEMFGSIAEQYDKNNAILSMNLHKRWNKSLVERVTRGKKPDSLLDLCCGTGDITFEYLKKTKQKCHAYLLDFCEEMLQCAKNKAEQLPLEQHHLTYLKADAQEVPLPNASISCITIAYGIRNVQDPRLCVREMYRLLEPGGHVGILELTQPKNRIMRFGHKVYLRYVLPRMGPAYKYLCSSIQSFIEPQVLADILWEEGFEEVSATPMSGGIATIITGKKI